MILQEKRIRQDFAWLRKNMRKFQKKIPGKCVAVTNKRVAGIGRTAKEAYDKAKLLYPNMEPVMDIVPKIENCFYVIRSKKPIKIFWKYCRS